MNKKLTKNKNQESLLSAITEINKAIPQATKDNEDKIVDIITFCEDVKYLDLKNQGVKLFPSQRVILKAFYMGTLGNEDLQLSKDDWDYLYSIVPPINKENYVYETNIKEVIEKLLKRQRDPVNSKHFSELQLVLGRRSSKTFIASIITTYEVYKLLSINKGDPHSFYRLPKGDTIAIINVALSLDQASTLFNMIQTRIRQAPFFNGKVAKETTSEIRFHTEADLAEIDQKGKDRVPGSILILCGHSNPDSLAGKNAVLILFDELAFFDDSGKVTGKYFYGRLKPSLAHFSKFGIARTVEISSPHARSGIFYDIYKNAKTNDSVLSIQLPTWVANPEIQFDDDELVKARELSFDLFTMEYGSQWINSVAYGKFFEPEIITKCIKADIGPHRRPDYKFTYYLHIDPAKKGNNYSAVLIGKQRYTDHLGQKRQRCVLANLWVWKPKPGVGLNFHEIDRQVLAICRIYHPALVTYDSFNNQHSMEFLRSYGITTYEISFNQKMKAKMYQNLKHLMAYLPEPELWLYDDGSEECNLFLGELRDLRFKSISRGYSITPDKHGDIKTDDLADGLAGACSSIGDAIRPSLPNPVVVRCGIF